MTSVIAREFGLAPSVAEEQDVELCTRIMALRRYAEAKAEVDAGVPQKQMRSDEAMIAKVVEVKVKRIKGEV